MYRRYVRLTPPKYHHSTDGVSHQMIRKLHKAYQFEGRAIRGMSGYGLAASGAKRSSAKLARTRTASWLSTVGSRRSTDPLGLTLNVFNDIEERVGRIGDPQPQPSTWRILSFRRSLSSLEIHIPSWLCKAYKMVGCRSAFASPLRVAGATFMSIAELGRLAVTKVRAEHPWGSQAHNHR
jgi:hypothetical protein